MLHKDSQAMKIEPVDISSDLDVAHVAGDIQEKHRGDGEASQGASSATSVSVGSHQLGHLGRFSVLVLPPKSFPTLSVFSVWHRSCWTWKELCMPGDDGGAMHFMVGGRRLYFHSLCIRNIDDIDDIEPDVLSHW